MDDRLAVAAGRFGKAALRNSGRLSVKLAARGLSAGLATGALAAQARLALGASMVGSWRCGCDEFGRSRRQRRHIRPGPVSAPALRRRATRFRLGDRGDDHRVGGGLASGLRAQREADRLAGIEGDRSDSGQRRHLVGGMRRLGEGHPLLDPGIDLVRRDVLGGNDPGIDPVALQGVGQGQVLANPGVGADGASGLLRGR